MSIKTSYFAKYKEPNGVSISLFTPKWFTGESYYRLAPNREILNDYKAGKLTEKQFEKRYNKEVLSKLDPYEIYQTLNGKVLLCYETPDKFCHRHLVAKWLNESLSVQVEEFKPKKKYNKIVIGIDESYQESGIGIMGDKKLIKYYGIKFPKCKTKSEKRAYMRKVLNSVIQTCLKKTDNIVLLVERIRTFSAKQKGGFSLSMNYIKSTASLITTIVDTAYDYGIETYSVDTRSWKAQVLGHASSTGGKNNSTGSKNKSTAIEHVLDKYNVDVSYITKTGKKKYNDNIADGICITEYGFIPESRQKLKLEL